MSNFYDDLLLEAMEVEPPRRPGAGLFEWLQMILGCVLVAFLACFGFALVYNVRGRLLFFLPVFTTATRRKFPDSGILCRGTEYSYRH